MRKSRVFLPFFLSSFLPLSLLLSLSHFLSFLPSFLSTTISLPPTQDSAESVDARVRSEMHSEVVEVYASVGKILKTYTSGKLPKAFKILPVLRNWEEVLYVTKPEEWSPCAVYQGEGWGGRDGC